jgi:hypothetical protein
MLRLPRFLDSRLTDGDEVVSLTRRPPFNLRKIPELCRIDPKSYTFIHRGEGDASGEQNWLILLIPFLIQVHFELQGIGNCTAICSLEELILSGYDAIIISVRITSNNGTVYEYRIGNDFEGIDRGLIKILNRNYHKEPEKNHENS